MKHDEGKESAIVDKGEETCLGYFPLRLSLSHSPGNDYVYNVDESHFV